MWCKTKSKQKKLNDDVPDYEKNVSHFGGGERKLNKIPEMWEKVRVSEAIANPAAKAIPMAGGVWPDQGTKEPHTIKMRKKEARHSATMDRQKSRDRISACIGTRCT